MSYMWNHFTVSIVWDICVGVIGPHFFKGTTENGVTVKSDCCSWNQPCHQLVSTRQRSIIYRTLHNNPLWQCLDHTIHLMAWRYLKSTVFPRHLADEHNLNKRISEEINDISPAVLHHAKEVLWTKCINLDGCLMSIVFTD